MIHRVRRVTAILVLIVGLGGGTWGDSFDWTAAGVAGDWSDPGNWNKTLGVGAQVVPGAGDVAAIPTLMLNYPSANTPASLSQLDIAVGASVALSGPMTVTGAVNNAGSLDLDIHNLSVVGGISGGTVTTNTGGTITAPGTITTLTIASDVTLDGGAGLSITNALASGNVTTAGSVTLQGTVGNLTVGGATSASGPLVVTGTLNLNAATLTLGVNPLTVTGNISRTNPGQISSGGTVTLNGVAQSANFTGSSLTTLTVAASGAVTLVPPASVTTVNFNNTGGSVTVNTAVLTTTSLATLGNAFAVTFNTAPTVTNAVSFANIGPLALAAGGTFNGGVTATAATSVTLAGVVSSTGAMDFGAAPVLLSGNTTLASGAATTTLGGTLDGGGFSLTLNAMDAASSLAGVATNLVNVTVNTGSTFTFGAAVTLTGQLSITSSTVDVGASILSFGTYSSGTGDTVAISGGTLVATAAGGTLTDLTVTGSATLQGGAGATGIAVTNAVANALTTTGKVSVNGNVTTVANSGTLTLNGNLTATGVVNNTGTLATSTFTLDVSGGASGLSGGGTVVNGGVIALGAQSLDASTGGISGAGSVTTTGGTLTATGTIATLTPTTSVTLDGAAGTLTVTASLVGAADVTVTGGTVNAGGALGVLTVSGGTLALSSNTTATSFSQSAGAFTHGAATFGVTGAFNQTAGTFTQGTGALSLDGNVTVAGTFTKNGAGSLVFGGGITQTLAANARDLGNATVTGAATILSVGNQSVTFDDLTTAASGELLLDAAGGSVVVSLNSGSTLANGGSVRVVGTGPNTATLQATAGTVSFTGSDVAWSNGETLTLGSVLYAPSLAMGVTTATVRLANGTNTFTNVSVGGGTFDANGQNWLVSGNWLNAGVGSLTNAAGTVTLSGAGASLNGGGVAAGKAFGPVAVTGTVTLTGATQAATLSGAGTLTTGAQSLTVTGNLTVANLTATASETVTVGGNFAPGAFTAATSAVDLTGMGVTLSPAGSFYDLTLTGTVTTLSSALTTTRHLSIGAAGGLTNGASALTVHGDWSNANGAAGFTAGAGMVTISNATLTSHAVTGNTTFRNLTIDASGTASGATVTFANVSTTTLQTGGTVVLQGAATKLLSLVEAAGSWNLVRQAGVTVTSQFLTVRQSTLATTAIAASSSKDAGGNTLWTFPASTLTWNGGATDGLWTSAGNWDLGYVPNDSDNAVIVTAGTNLNLNGLSSATTSITNLTVNGTVAATGAGSLEVQGNLSVGASGVFSTPANVTWVMTGTATVGSTPVATIGNLTVQAGAGTVSLSGNVQVANLTLTSGTLAAAANQLSATGSISTGGGSLTFTGAGLLVLNGTGAQTLDPTGSTFRSLTVNNVTGPVQLTNTGLTLGANLLVTAGSFDPNGQTVTLSGAANFRGDVVNTGAAAGFTASGTLTLTGAATIDTNGGPLSLAAVTGAQTLGLTATGSALTVSGTIGTVPLTTLTASADTISVVAVTTTGAQSYTAATSTTLNGTLTVNTLGAGIAFSGPVLLAAGGGTLALTGSHAANVVSFSGSSTVNGAQPLSITTGALGSVTFGALVGGSTRPTTLTLSTGTATPSAAVNLGSLALTAGTLALAAQPLNLQGNLTQAGGAVSSSGTITLDGTGAQSVDFSTSATLQDLTLNKTAGTVTLAGNVTLAGALTVTDGGLTAGAPRTVQAASATFAGSGTVTGTNLNFVVTGNGGWDDTAFAGTWTTGGSLVFSGATPNLATSHTLATVTVNNGTALATSTAATVGALTVTGTGSWTTGANTLTAASIGGTGTLDATLAATVAATGNVSISNYLAAAATTVGGNWSVPDATFTHNNGTVTFNGAGTQTLATGSATPANGFYNLTLASTGMLRPATTGANQGWLVANALTLTSGTLSQNDGAASFNTITYGGAAWNDTGVTFTQTGGTVVLTRSGAVALTSSGSFFNLTLGTGASATAVTLGSAATVAGTLSILATASLDISGSNFALSVGSASNAGTFTAQNGTVTVTGTSLSGTWTGASSFWSVVFNGTTTLAAPITLGANLTLNATRTLAAAGNTITLGGNWTNSAGAANFTPGGATLVIAGATTHTFTGATNFANFTNTVAGSTLTFTAATTFGVTGTLTLTGAVGNLITVQSSTASTTTLNNSVAGSVAFVSVSYVAANASTITAATSADLGNNTNWIFSAIDWLGTTADANLGSNWASGVTPATFDAANVPSGQPSDPTQSANLTLRSLTVQAGANWTNAGFNLVASSTITNNGTLTYSGGTVTGLGATVGGTVVYDVGASAPLSPTSYNNLTVNGGAVTQTVTTAVTGAFLVSAGTWTVPVTLALNLSGASHTVTTTGTLATAGTINLTAAADLNVTATGVLNNTGVNTINASGNVSFLGTFSGTATNGTLVMTGNAKTLNATATLGNLTVNPGGGNTVALATNALSLAGNATLTSGTLSTANLGLNVAGNVTGAGALTLGSSLVSVQGNFTPTGTVTPGTSVLTLDGGAAQTLTVTAGSLFSLTVNNASGVVASGANLTLGGTLTQTAGALALGVRTLNLAGGAVWGAGSTTFTGAGLLNLNGTALQTVDFHTGTLQNVTVNNTSGLSPAVALSGALTAASAFIHTAGILDLGGHAFTANTTSALASTTITNSGAAANLTFTGAVTLSGAGTTSLTTNGGNISFLSVAETTAGLESLTLAAGAGDVTFTGAVGATRLNVLTITNADAVTFSTVSTVSVNAFDQLAGTGTTTFSANVTTNAAAGFSLVSAGAATSSAGTLTISSATGNGPINFNTTPLSVTGSLTLAGAPVTSAINLASLTPAADGTTVFIATAASFTSGALGTGGFRLSTMTITTDALSFTGGASSVHSNSTITIRPTTTGTSMGLAGAAGTLSVSQVSLSAIANTATSVTFGRTLTTALTVNAANFQYPTILRANGGGGTIAVNGALTNTAGFAITFQSGGTTTLAANVSTNAGDLDFTAAAGGVVVGAASVTLTTASGGNAGAINLPVALSANLAGAALALNASAAAGNGGAVTLAAVSNGGGQFLQDLTVATAATGTPGTFTDAAINALQVMGTLTLDLGTSSIITLTNAANDFGTLTVTSATDVSVRDANALVLGGPSTLFGALTVISGGALTQSGWLDANLVVVTNTSAATTLDHASNQVAHWGPIAATGRTVTLRNTVVSDQVGGGAITASGLDLLGSGPYTLANAANAITTLAGNTTAAISYTNNANLAVGTLGSTGLTSTGAVSLTVTGNVTQSQPISANALTVTTTTGQTLTGANTVNNFTAANTAGGAVQFTNTAAPLTLAGATQTAGGAITVVNTGALTVSGNVTAAAGAVSLTATGIGVNTAVSVTGPAGLTVNATTGTLTLTGTATLSNGGGATAVSLVSDDAFMGAGASITAGSGAVGVTSSTIAQPITLGGGGSGLGWSSTELNRITTTGTLTLGDAAHSGTIATDGAVALTGPAGPVQILTTGGAITLNHGFSTQGNLTLDATQGAVVTAAVTGTGQLTVGATGTAALTVVAGSGLDLNNVLNQAVTLNLTNRTGGGNLVYHNNKTGATVTAVNQSAGGTLLVNNHTGTLATAVGGVTTTGAGAADLTLVSAGALTLTAGATVVAGGSGFVSLNAAGATQGVGATVTAPGGMALQGTGNFTLTQTNVSPVLATSVTGNVSFTTSSALDLGSVAGVTGASSTNLTLVSAALTQSQSVVTGTLVLTSTGSVTLDETGGNNTIATLGAVTRSGAFVLNDHTGLTVTGPIGSHASAVTVTTTGALTVNGAITTTGANNVALTGVGITAGAPLINAGAGTITVHGGGGTVDLGTSTLRTTNASATAVQIDLAGVVHLGNVDGGIGVALPGTLVLGTGAANLTGALDQNATTSVNVTTLTGSTGGTVDLSRANTVANLAAVTTNGATLVTSAGAPNVTGAVFTTGGGLTLATASGLAITTGSLNAGAGTVRLNNTAGTVTQVGTITAAGLQLVGAAFTLNAANQVATFAASASGAVAFTSAQAGGVTVGSVTTNAATTNGITLTNQSLALTTTGGAVTVSNAIATGSGTVTFTTSSGTTTQGAGIAITTSGGLELLGTGTFTLAEATNSLALVAGNITGDASLRSTGAVAVSLVGATSGWTATGNLTLHGSGAWTQGALRNVVVGGLELLGSGPYTLANANNNITTLAGNVTGAVSYTDLDTLAIGTVNTVGLTTPTLTLVVNGAGGGLTQSAALAVSGTLTVTAAANSVVLADATNTFSIVTLPSVGVLTLNAAGSYALNNVTATGNVDLSTAAGDLTVASGFTLALSGAGTQDLHPTGNVVVVGRITTTGGPVQFNPGGQTTLGPALNPAVASTAAGGDLSFLRPVVLTANTVLTATANNVTFAAAATVNASGGSRSLTVNAGVGQVTFNGSVGQSTPLGALTVTSASQAAGVTFAQAVTLAAASALTVTNGGVVQVQGAVSAPGGFSSTGTGAFTSTVAGTITTALTNAISIATTTGAGAVTVGGTLTTVSTGAVTLDSAGSTVALNAAVSTVSGIVNIDSLGTTTVAAAGDVAATGASTVNFGQTRAGTVSTAGDVTTAAGAVRWFRAVALTGPVQVATGGGAVTFSGSMAGGAQNLTLDAGAAGSVLFSSTVDNLAQLTLTNSNGMVVVGNVGSITPGNVTITNTTAAQTVDFQGTVTNIATLTANPGLAYHVRIAGSNTPSTVTTGVFSHTGNLVLGGSTTADITVTSGITHSSGASILNGAIRSGANDQTYAALSLAGDASLHLGTANFNGIVTGNAHTLTVNGDLAVAASMATLTSLVVTGTSALNGGAVTTSGIQTYTGAVTLGSATTLTGSTVTFSSTLGNASSQTLAVVGNSVFSGSVGVVGAVPLTSLTVSLNSDINGGAVTTSGIQTYTGPVRLGAATTLTGSTVTFSSTLGNASSRTLAVVGNAVFSGTVGLTPAVALTSLTVSLNSDINGGAVTTSGIQTYTGAVTLGSATTLTGSTVTFSSTLGNASSQTLAVVGNAVFSGTVGLTPAVALTSLTVSLNSDINGGAVTTSGIQTYTGPVRLGAATTLTGTTVTFSSTLGNASSQTLAVVGNAVFSGTVGLTPAVALTSLTVSLTSAINGGAVTTSGIQTYSGPVTLGTSTILTTTNAAILLSSTLDGGNFNLALAATNGSGTFTVTGAVTNLGTGVGAAFTVPAAAVLTGLVRFNSTVTAANGFSVGAFVALEFADNITITGSATPSTFGASGTVLFSRAGGQTWASAGGVTFSGTTTVSGAGLLTLGPDAAATLITVSVPGTFNQGVGGLTVIGTFVGTGGTLVGNAAGTLTFQPPSAGTSTVTLGTFTPSGGQAVLVGANALTLNGNSQHFHNLTLQGAGTITLGADLFVDNVLNQTAGTLDAALNDLVVRGNLTLTTVSNPDRLYLVPIGAQSVSLTGPTLPLVVAYASGAGSITQSTAINAGSLLALRGTWNANGFDLNLSGDLVAYGAGYQTYNINAVPYLPSDDGELAVTRTATNGRLGYPYFAPAVGAVLPSVTSLKAPLDVYLGGNTAINAVALLVPAPDIETAAFTFAGAETWTVAGNFYNYGASMTGVGVWNLNLPAPWATVKVNAAPTTDWFGRPFAVALSTGGGMTISNSNASQPIAAAQTAVATIALDVTSNIATGGNWDNTQPTIASASTRFDNLVEVTFSEAIQNVNGEASAAVGSATPADNFRFHTRALRATAIFDFFAGTPGTPGAFGVGEYTTQAATNVNKTTLSFRAELAVLNNAWNTNATGLTAGANSTDRSGAASTVVPNLALEKGRLVDTSGNPVRNYDGLNYNGAAAPALYTATADLARPVLVAVELGQAAKNFPPATEEDGHNYWHLVWSEPVDLDAAAVPGINTGGQIGSIPSATASGNLTADLSFGDSFSDDTGATAPAGTVQLTGMAQYPGNLYRGSRAQNAGDVQATQTTVTTTNSLARSAAGNDLYIYLTGDSTGAGNLTSWDGFWWGDTASPLGQNYTVVAAYVNQVTDRSAGTNPIEVSHISWLAADGGADPKTGYQITDDPSVSAALPELTTVAHAGWETEVPEFAPYTDLAGSYEIVPVDSDADDLIDQVQFHLLSNTTKSSQSWLSSSGHPDNATTPHFGVRDTSLTKFYQGFSLQLLSGGPVSNVNLSSAGVGTATTGVDNSLFNGGPPPIVGFSVANDGYFTQALDTGNPALLATWKPTVNYQAYYDAFQGMLTNLSGRLLESTPVGGVKAIDRTPPFISLTLTGKDMNTIYVQFSRFVSAVSPTSDPTFRDVLSLTGSTNSISSMTFLDGSLNSTNFQQALLHLASPFNPAEIASARLQAVVEGGTSTSIVAGQNLMDLTVTYPVTFLGLNLIEPVWASDGQGAEANRTGTAHVIHDFTGRESLAPRDIELQAKVWGGAALAALPLRLFYDLEVPASRIANGIWLPTGLFSFVPGVVPLLDNGQTRYLDPVSSSGTLRNFLVPGTDAELKSGSRLQFLFRLGSLYALRGTDPQDPRKLAVWSVPLKGITAQKNGVTILQNVIDPTQGQKTQILYTMEKAGVIVAQVFALDGSLVKVLTRGRQAPGDYSVFWDGKNDGGSVVARGVYFVRVIAPGLDETRNILVVK